MESCLEVVAADASEIRSSWTKKTVENMVNGEKKLDDHYLRFHERLLYVFGRSEELGIGGRLVVLLGRKNHSRKTSAGGSTLLNKTLLNKSRGNPEFGCWKNF